MEERIIGLETRIAFFEKLVEELNQVVFRQQEEIDGLRTSIELLTEKSNSAGSLMADSSQETPPPHY